MMNIYSFYCGEWYGTCNALDEFFAFCVYYHCDGDLFDDKMQIMASVKNGILTRH